MKATARALAIVLPLLLAGGCQASAQGYGPYHHRPHWAPTHYHYGHAPPRYYRPHHHRPHHHHWRPHHHRPHHHHHGRRHWR